MEEIWKPIKGYEGHYEISSIGRVKSIKRMSEGTGRSCRSLSERMLSITLFRNGYEKVMLRKNGKDKCYRVHRLVAESFIDNPNGFLEVNHKNEIKTDNSVDNLEWCNRQYNCNYGTRNDRIVKYNSKKVLQFTKEMVYVGEYSSLAEAARINGFKQSHIGCCCNGKRLTSNGFIWKYGE